jgi:hypothetical protein
LRNGFQESVQVRLKDVIGVQDGEKKRTVNAGAEQPQGVPTKGVSSILAEAIPQRQSKIWFVLTIPSKERRLQSCRGGAMCKEFALSITVRKEHRWGTGEKRWSPAD